MGAKSAIRNKVAPTVEDKEVDALFTEHKDEVPLRSVSHILFQYKGADHAPRDMTRTKDEAKKLAEDTLKQAQAGKDFAELAKASEDDFTKVNGGAVDFFPLKGDKAMADAFGAAAYKLEKIGAFAPVVETPYGFHVIKLTGLRDEEFKKQIRLQLAAEKTDELMYGLHKAAIDKIKFSAALTTPPPGLAPPAQAPEAPAAK
jgi:peptidyl-prolyl cis-trans isomerase D